jgi:type IV pilus assembly protein PilC
MSRYRYRACDAHGQIVQGEIEAANHAELESRLRGRGLEPIHIKTARPSWRRQRIPRRELIHFCFHLEQMLGAGIPILDVLADLADGQGHSGVKAIASGLYAEVERGQPLSCAMKQYPHAFDEVFRCMLRAGESTGDLAPVLRQIAADLARADEIRANAQKIVIYPLVVGSVLCVAIAVALTQVVPQVATLFRSNGQILPLSTRLLIGLSDWFRHYAWLLPLIVIPSSVALFITAARRPTLRRRLHAFALRLPLIGPITQRLALARTANLLAMLYASGITVIDAIASTAHATPNLAIRQGIETAGAHIAAGRGIASAFESVGIFPRLVTKMLRVGEQTGRLDSALGQLVYFYERDAREAIERLQASIEPALTIVMGLLMLWIAIAVLGPIYDIITRLPV